MVPLVSVDKKTKVDYELFCEFNKIIYSDTSASRIAEAISFFSRVLCGSCVSFSLAEAHDHRCYGNKRKDNSSGSIAQDS